MNSRTKQALLEFITEVENLAAAVMVTTGVETATKVVDTAEKLKLAINHDETITEVR